MQPKELPIGYWIKMADEMLTKNINDLQASLGLTRTEWQVLSYIRNNEVVVKPVLMEIMMPFAVTSSIEMILASFKSRDLIWEQDLALTLTGKGQELYSTCFEKQNLFREAAMVNISEQEYVTTLMTLKKIIQNIIGSTT